ncbi:SGNH/GDSL hydrolase family protein [Erwinia sp. Eh17-17]|uniref:SGNH/GDSL hydrolase family protein n=1 Tax=Erwinia sp. Eh17-17 TaxID=3080330 RepID=UPI0032097C12
MNTSRRVMIKLFAPLALIPSFISSAKVIDASANQPDQHNNDTPPARASFAANLLADQKSIKIECFGDSTMWGSIPHNTTTMDPANPSASLQKALDLIFPGLVKVKNSAIPGTTLKLLLTGRDSGPGTYEERLMKSDALIIYCNHCLNDCNSYESDESQYRQNLIEFVRLTRQYGKIPILVTPSIISPVGDGKEFMMKRMPAFIKTMKDVASHMNVDLVDNYYYSYKTSRMTPASKINGDGVHLNSEAYQNAGWNMAIPLVLANTLNNPYDLCGLSNSTFKDNLTLSRAIWSVDSRFGSVLTADSNDSLQHIYFPVILDNPTDHTRLAIGGFNGEAGGTGEITYFGERNDHRYSGRIDYKKDVEITYDKLFEPSACKLSAGFHIIGVEASAEEGGKNFNFAGVQLIPSAVI